MEWTPDEEAIIRARSGTEFFLASFNDAQRRNCSQSGVLVDQPLKPPRDTNVNDIDRKYFVLHKFIGDIVWMSGVYDDDEFEDEEGAEMLAIKTPPLETPFMLPPELPPPEPPPPPPPPPPELDPPELSHSVDALPPAAGKIQADHAPLSSWYEHAAIVLSLSVIRVPLNWVQHLAVAASLLDQHAN
ncbi:hypothetical protein C8J57DRAFT_1510509 [Mycena rebaudengoi]|nr:hypothetical protein C8J57DRAFT_1510509 [Mycena rebaudengoi]